MKTRHSNQFVCVDCETTGLDVDNDRIIEVAVALFDNQGNITQSYESLVNPLCPIPESSTEIHHITDKMVQDKPLIYEVLPKVLSMISSYTIVGHGVDFDIQLLINAAKKNQMTCSLSKNPIIDTLRLARLYGRCPVNSLERLREHFNIQAEGAHRAMSDVIVNIAVFKQLSKSYKNQEQIFKVLSKPIALEVMPLGKHKGRPFRDIPLSYLNWAKHQDFDLDLLFSIRSEIKRRRKGNLFSQSFNPFQDL